MSTSIKMDNNYESICRICLNDKAVFPIFEKLEEDEGSTCIKSMISLCMNEEIYDINGFPRHICGVCNNTLTSMCNLITTYKESHKMLLEKSTKENIAPILNFNSKITLELKSKIKKDCDIYKGNMNNETEYLEDISKYEANDELERSQYIRLVTNDEKIKDKKQYHKKKNIIHDSLPQTSNIGGDVIQNGKTCRLHSKKDQKNKKRSLTIKAEDPKSHKPNKTGLDIENSVLCDICGATFKKLYYLKGHTARHKQNPTKCPQCPKVLINPHQLKRHIRSQHGKNKYMCQQCSAVFYHQPSLTCHIKNVHNKVEKKLSCHLCDKSYASKTSLIIHHRSVHTGERPEVCSVCNARFFHKSYLKEHMMIHTGETPYKCPICERGYPHKGNMLSHIKHNHKLSDLTSEQIKRLKPIVLKRLKT